MKIFWPFKKKIEILFVDTETEKARKLEEERLNKEREEQNKAFMEEKKTFTEKWLKETLEFEVLKFKEKNRQPFQPGDIVTVDYYRYPSSVGGWLATTRQFVQTFHEYKGIAGPMDLKVSRVWVSTGWLADLFDYKFNGDTHEILATSKSIEELERRLYTRLVRIRTGKNGNIMEWAFDCDWKELNFTKEGDDKPLDLRWGGFPCSSAIPADSEMARAQKKLYEGQLAMEKARVEYEQLENSFERAITAVRSN